MPTRMASQPWKMVPAFPLERPSALPATRAAWSCATAGTAGWWRSTRGPGRFRRPSGAPCTIATAGAASRAVEFASARAITSVTGLRGGPTTLSNFATLCRRHHRAVHEEGYKVECRPDGTLRFRRPDGRLLPEVPPLPEVPLDPVGTLRARHEADGLDLHAQTGLPSWTGESLDVGWAIGVLHPLAR